MASLWKARGPRGGAGSDSDASTDSELDVDDDQPVRRGKSLRDRLRAAADKVGKATGTFASTVSQALSVSHDPHKDERDAKMSLRELLAEENLTLHELRILMKGYERRGEFRYRHQKELDHAKRAAKLVTRGAKRRAQLRIEAAERQRRIDAGEEEEASAFQTAAMPRRHALAPRGDGLAGAVVQLDEDGMVISKPPGDADSSDSSSSSDSDEEGAGSSNDEGASSDTDSGDGSAKSEEEEDGDDADEAESKAAGGKNKVADQAGGKTREAPSLWSATNPPPWIPKEHRRRWWQRRKQPKLSRAAERRLREQWAASKVQAAYRRMVARRIYAMARYDKDTVKREEAARFVQRMWRVARELRAFRRMRAQMHEAAWVVQRNWRFILWRHGVEQTKQRAVSALRIQRWWRSLLAREALMAMRFRLVTRAEGLNKARAYAMMGRLLMGYMARKRARKERKRRVQQILAASLLQAWWRAHLVRKLGEHYDKTAKEVELHILRQAKNEAAFPITRFMRHAARVSVGRKLRRRHRDAHALINRVMRGGLARLEARRRRARVKTVWRFLNPTKPKEHYKDLIFDPPYEEMFGIVAAKPEGEALDQQADQFDRFKDIEEQERQRGILELIVHTEKLFWEEDFQRRGTVHPVAFFRVLEKAGLPLKLGRKVQRKFWEILSDRIDYNAFLAYLRATDIGTKAAKGTLGAALQRQDKAKTKAGQNPHLYQYQPKTIAAKFAFQPHPAPPKPITNLGKVEGMPDPPKGHTLRRTEAIVDVGNGCRGILVAIDEQGFDMENKRPSLRTMKLQRKVLRAFLRFAVFDSEKLEHQLEEEVQGDLEAVEQEADPGTRRRINALKRSLLVKPQATHPPVPLAAAASGSQPLDHWAMLDQHLGLRDSQPGIVPPALPSATAADQTDAQQLDSPKAAGGGAAAVAATGSEWGDRVSFAPGTADERSWGGPSPTSTWREGLSGECEWEGEGSDQDRERVLGNGRPRRRGDLVDGANPFLGEVATSMIHDAKEDDTGTGLDSRIYEDALEGAALGQLPTRSSLVMRRAADDAAKPVSRRSNRTEWAEDAVFELKQSVRMLSTASGDLVPGTGHAGGTCMQLPDDPMQGGDADGKDRTFRITRPILRVRNGKLQLTTQASALYVGLLARLQGPDARGRDIMREEPAARLTKLIFDNYSFLEMHWQKLVADLRSGSLHPDLRISPKQRRRLEAGMVAQPERAAHLESILAAYDFQRRAAARRNASLNVNFFKGQKAQVSRIAYAPAVRSHNHRRKHIPARLNPPGLTLHDMDKPVVQVHSMRGAAAQQEADRVLGMLSSGRRTLRPRADKLHPAAWPERVPTERRSWRLSNAGSSAVQGGSGQLPPLSPMAAAAAAGPALRFG